ncbi:MAG: hypothetical protein QOG60_1978, partial [Frankiaceae bacterium]|nr:hypothetical protein [Frankiaceae bacterium]
LRARASANGDSKPEIASGEPLADWEQQLIGGTPAEGTEPPADASAAEAPAALVADAAPAPEAAVQTEAPAAEADGTPGVPAAVDPALGEVGGAGWGTDSSATAPTTEQAGS